MDKQVTVTFSPKTILWVIATLIALWLVFVLREAIIIVFISFIFAAAADPLVDLLEKKKVPRVLSITAILLLVVLIIFGIFRVILPPTIDQFTALSQNRAFYVDKIVSYFHNLSPAVADRIKANTLGFLSNFGSSVTSGILSGAIGVFNGIFDFILVLVISFYLLLEKDGTEKWISSYAPKKYQTKTITIAKKITTKMSYWFRGQMAVALIVALADLLALSVLHINYALSLALLAGFLEFLPIIGPAISTVLATLVALTISPILGIIVLVYYLLVQQLENHILVPQIMKRSVGLHPIAVIVAILIGGKLLGLLGIIIAVPIAAAISVIYNEIFRVNSEGGK